MHAARASRFDLCEALLFSGALISVGGKSALDFSKIPEISRLLRQWSLRKIPVSQPALQKWQSPELAALPISR